MRGKAVLLVIIFSLLLLVPAGAQIYMGTVEGYIKYANSSIVPGASVSITVSGCSGAGCSASTTSQSNGYYVVANLNIPAGGTVAVTATKSGASGSNSGVADAGYAAYVNITFCPSSPTSLASTGYHNLTAVLSWTSGVEISTDTTYDQYEFNSGGFSTTTSPKNQAIPTYNNPYTWRVRTCNSVCCSAPASSTVTSINTQPTAPVLTDQPNTHNTTVTLCWTSGTDSDTNPVDVLHDEFYFDDDSDPESGPIFSNTSMPTGSYCRTISGLTVGQTYWWRVKTCDNTGAGNACGVSTDTFTVSNSPPSAPTLTEQVCAASNNASLQWTSGTDPEGDTTYDVYEFGEEGNYSTHVEPATSPQAENVQSCKKYYWRVKTCDSSGLCSNWATDDFIACAGAVVTPTEGVCPSGGAVGQAGIYCPASYIVSVSAPSQLKQGSNISLLVNFKSDADLSNLKFEIAAAEGIEISSIELPKYTADTNQLIVLSGVIGETMPLGRQTFTLNILVSDKIVLAKSFDVLIVEKEITVCGNGACEESETAENCIQDCHCGDNICQSEFGENPAICPDDCKAVLYLTPLQAIILTICIAIFGILFLWSRSEWYKLVQYILRRLKAGENIHSIKSRLKTIGWKEETVERASKKALKKHKPKIKKIKV